MRRLAPISLLVAVAAVAAPSRGTPVVAPRVDTLVRAGAAHPWLIRGDLAAPSTRPAIDVAKDVLARHAAWTRTLELAHVETLDVDGARVVTFRQTMAGVPVLHRGARVVVESDGSATLLSTDLEERRPRSLAPAVPASAALATAAAHGAPANDLGARLMVLPTGGEPRLVWAIVADLGPLPSRPVVLVDAQTGEIAQQWDSVVFAQKAKVFDQNPIRTPTTIDVTLANDTTKEGLQNANVVAKNCIDKKTTKTIAFGPGITVHTCELLATIAPDASGDYLDVKPASDTEPEDKYAELSMFFHTDKVYEFAKKIGFPATAATQVTAIANLRVPAGFSRFDLAAMADPNKPLQPFDNAFFAQKDPLLSTTFGVETDAMWFGQGTLADFGYDGDVVYHEFGHYVVSRTIKLGGATFVDEFGATYSPGALNEAIADVLSFFVTDEPELGEYAAKGIGAKGKGMRSATNTFVFPRAITGEVHHDGEPVVGAVWKVYSTLDATKKTAFQKAFMKTLATAPSGNLGYADFAELLVKGVTTGVDAATGNALSKNFQDRGIVRGDPRVRPWAAPRVSSVDARLGVHAPGKSEVSSKGDLAPGLFQIRYDAPAGGVAKVHVAFKILARGGAFGSSGGSPFGSRGTPFDPRIVVKAGGDPIKWKYGPTTHDGVASGACTTTKNPLGQIDSAKCEVDVEVQGKWGETAPIHVMIANAGDNGAEYDDVVIAVDAPPEPSPNEPNEPAAGPPADAGGSKGCGCATPGHGGSAAGASAIALGAALVLARRRRR